MTDNDQTSRLGVSITQQRVLESGHIFREQPQPDFGIDAQFEIKDGAIATGRLIAVQIKAGSSYFADGTATEFWHYVSDRHRELWTNHSLPVVLVLCDVESQVCFFSIVDQETCIRAGSRWKVIVPKRNTLTSESSHELVSLASPIAAASDFSIHAENDESFGLARRISLDVVVHPGNKTVTKPLLGAIVRAALKRGQSSQYHHDQISETVLGGRPVDVVYGFVFMRDIDRASAAWVCRFQWISPGLEVSLRPPTFEGELDGSGLVIDWNGNAELPRFLDESRATKADYLKCVDRLLAQLPAVRKRLASLLAFADQSPFSTDFTVLAEGFERSWDGSFSAPAECQRLHQAIHELLATVGNAALISNRQGSRSQAQARSLLISYNKELDRLEGDISFLRRDVR